MNRILYRDEMPGVPALEPIELGGTTANNATLALNHLNLIKQTDVGHVASAVPLGPDSIVPAEFLDGVGLANGNTLDANLTVYTLVTSYFTISNYDYQRVYVITATAGTVELVTPDNPVLGLDFGTIIYTPPVTAQPVILSINGREYPIDVQLSHIEKPTFVWPINNAVITILHPVLEASLFACVGYQDEQISSTFEYASDPTFTNIIGSYFNDSGHGESGPFSEDRATLTAAGDYYVRVKYEGITLGESVWSDTLHIERQISSPFPVLDYAKITAAPLLNQGDSLGNFGEYWQNIAINYNGKTLVSVSENYQYNGDTEGLVWVFYDNGTVWEKHHIETPRKYSQIGVSTDYEIQLKSPCAISADGQTILVTGIAINNPASINSGSRQLVIMVFRTTVVNDYTTLTKICEFDYSLTTIENYADDLVNVAVTPDFSKICISFFGTGIHYLTFDGVSTITHQSIFGSYYPYNREQISISNDGNTLLSSVSNDWVNLPDYHGIIKIFNFANNTWSLTETITADLNAPEIFFGDAVALSPDGNKFIASANIDVNYDPNRGTVIYIYEKINNSWTKSKKYSSYLWKDDFYGSGFTSAAFNPGGNFALFGSGNRSNSDTFPISQTPYDNGGAAYLIDDTTVDLTILNEYNESPPNLQALDIQFGDLVAYSGDGNTIVCSYHRGTDCGLFIFK